MPDLADLPDDQQAWVRDVVEKAPELTPAQQSKLLALFDGEPDASG
jgi:hypothetical protein